MKKFRTRIFSEPKRSRRFIICGCVVQGFLAGWLPGRL